MAQRRRIRETPTADSPDNISRSTQSSAKRRRLRAQDRAVTYVDTTTRDTPARRSVLRTSLTQETIVVLSDSSDESEVVEFSCSAPPVLRKRYTKVIPCDDEVEVITACTSKQQSIVVGSQSQEDAASDGPVLEVHVQSKVSESLHMLPAVPPPVTEQPKPFASPLQPLSPALSQATPSVAQSVQHGIDHTYYLNIFDRIMTTVLIGESHLFSESEQKILQTFIDLERQTRYIYTRLFMRKPTWIRITGLKYGNAEHVAQACKTLSVCRPCGTPFALGESDVTDCEELLEMMQLPELRELAKRRGLKKMNSKNKDTIRDAILKQTKQRTVLSFFKKGTDSATDRFGALIKDAVSITGPLVKLNPKAVELFERLHLVYFRHLLQSLDDNPMKVAVLALIGKLRFPNYTVSRSTDLFESREAVVQYKELLQVGEQMAELGMSSVTVVEHHRQGWELYLAYRDRWLQHIKRLPKQPNASDGITYWRRRFTAGWALSRIVGQGAKFAAALKQFKDEEQVLLSLLSQTHYGRDKRGKWYERLVLVQATHLSPKKCNKEPDYKERFIVAQTAARKHCIRALADPYVNRVAQHRIASQLLTIERKLEIDPQHSRVVPALSAEWLEAPERTVYGVRIKNHSQRGASAWDGNDGIPCSVEELAIWRYQDDGYQGIHSENTLITTLFGLVFYDIIFSPLPGVLDTEYQSAPLDMRSDSFYFSRKDMIEQRIEDIKTGRFMHYLTDTYDLQQGSEIIGVNWEYTREWLEMICQCIGGTRLAVILGVLAREYPLKHSGFPDLCLWKPGTNDFMFAEVKGPNDKLSENQKDWIDILLSNDIKVEVCLVRHGRSNSAVYEDENCEEEEGGDVQ